MEKDGEKTRRTLVTFWGTPVENETEREKEKERESHLQKDLW